MKKFILITLIIITPSIGFSQNQKVFKDLDKTKSGSTHIDFNYNSVNHSSNLKSSSQNNKFQVSPNFIKPILKKDSLVKKILRSPKSGVPIYIEIENEKGNQKSAEFLSPRERFYKHFEKTKEYTTIKNPQDELIIKEIIKDDLGITHIKANQQYKGIEIYGNELFLHFNNSSEIFTGRISSFAINLDLSPNIKPIDGIDIATRDLKSLTILRDLSTKQREILNYEAPGSELLIYNNHKDFFLCYKINIRPNFIESWNYFIDAKNGNILFKYNDTKSDGPVVSSGYDLSGSLQTIDTYLENGTYYLINAAEDMFDGASFEGIIQTLDANNTSTVNLDYSNISSADNTWDHPAGISAHINATKTYRYLSNTFGRNSVNGNGGNIISFVNVANEDGSSMDNAYWNGHAAFYGNGNTVFTSLAGALDVTAHELGHGVVSNTANLEYYGQSGAINETYADFFGSMVDRDDWLIGEDITKTSYISTGALRNMADPHNDNLNGWQPMHTSEMYIGEEDNGGVHINSGIGNYAYYLYATAITKEKAEQVFYRALTYYLTKKSQFIDFRIAIVQSAKDLYGDNSNEVVEANNAFDAVGIFEEEQIDYEQDYSENDGADYLLSYDTDPANSNTLYRSSVNGDEFYPLTTTVMKGKVSVVDDGSGAVFVSENSQINAISTNPDNPDEFVLSSDEFWDNVAISKDGNRVACISIEVDTAIYVYDFVSAQWTKFHLYNPTTSHTGTDAGGVLYADAIEFDHTGEYIMYDAYNELASSSGDEISYWDIGFIKVWDNENNEFGDGAVEKLFGSLPDDVSIGNPVFSKNSPYLIAFDYWDSNLNEFIILGSNLLTGDLESISTNSRLGYPSYSRLDDKISFTAYNTNDEDVIAIINLASNKISSTEDPSVLIGDAIWSVYYATGTRELLMAPISNFTVDIKSGEAPLEVQFLDLSINNPTSWSWTFEGGDPSSSSNQNPSVTYNSEGTFQVSLTSQNSTGSNTNSKTSYINVSNSTSIEVNIEEIVSFYPNPVSDILNIKCDQNFKVSIYSLLGEKLIEVSNQNQINFTTYKQGIYLIKIEVKGVILNGKLLKR